jgi:hypothetical protein
MAEPSFGLLELLGKPLELLGKLLELLGKLWR